MPVLMFHSIGCENENWYRHWLSVSLDHFENFCKFLIKNKFETIFLDEWYANRVNSTLNSKKQIVITFDDGYLDNWVYAYPILKKYGLKGTIFINPEFIDNSEAIRYNLDDLWDKKIERNELSPLGFLNWAELLKMESTDVMDIQSHSMSHNFYFSSDKIKDLYNGQPHYDWMAWINRPDRKPYYNLENQESFVPKGTPIFEFDRALGLRRYFPNEKLIQYAIDLYSNEGGETDKKLLINKLNKKISMFPGAYESDEDMESRYRYELFESKQILEEKLNKQIDYLCWPGGGYNELSVKLSIDAGYKASTFSNKNKELIKTDYGNYKNIKRYAMTSFISTATKNHYIKNPSFLVNLFKYHQGNTFSKNKYRVNKLSLIILDKLLK